MAMNTRLVPLQKHLWIRLSQLTCLRAQLVEHLLRTQEVAGPNSTQGSSVFSLKITGCFGCMHLPCILIHDNDRIKLKVHNYSCAHLLVLMYQYMYMYNYVSLHKYNYMY